MKFARMGQSNDKHKINFSGLNKIIKWKWDCDKRLLQPRLQSDDVTVYAEYRVRPQASDMKLGPPDKRHEAWEQGCVTRCLSLAASLRLTCEPIASEQRNRSAADNSSYNSYLNMSRFLTSYQLEE